MRALTIDAHGGLEQLRFREDVPDPVLGSPTDVRVRMRAAALNHVDLWTVRGVPGVKIHPGWVLGSDGTGVVDQVGDAVTGIKPGDMVMINPGVSCGECEYCLAGDQPLCLRFAVLGEHRHGTLADLLVVPARNVRVIPPDTDPEQAAAYPLAMLTAWRMCVSRARVTLADHVLIWGIGGGVAQAALRICANKGATCWVTSGSEEKLARAREMGAQETLLHGPDIDIGRVVRERTGKRGVDVVIDSVGTATWRQSLGALGKRGRLVTCGGTSGSTVETDIRRMFWNQWTLMGSTMGSDAEFDAIVAAFIGGALEATVDSVYPIERADEAFARLESGAQFGKVVVRIS